MPKTSARDLLRQTRKQRQQHQQRGPGNTAQSALKELAARDEFARIVAGTLHCQLCTAQVKPADTVGWSVHTKSRRHLQNIASRPAESSPGAAKRNHDDVSDHLEQRLNIDTALADSEVVAGDDDQPEQHTETKRRRVDGLVAYGSDEESDEENDTGDMSDGEGDGGEESDSARQTDSTAEAGKLPKGFFDDGIEPTVTDTDEVDERPDRVGMPAEPADHEKQLDDSLAAFESEIANLAGPSDLEEAKPADDLETQAEVWTSRTRHLAQLHSIVKAGMGEMDPNEDKSRAMDEGSSEESSSGEECAELTSWRSGCY
ncbi:hypothetical protein H4S02_003214 [Coemansia sp. RSA 2611]|nr:hypothetical protein IWW54_000909 [Coemansia sp. RSA 2705]KAJ2317665.1 hypothetical protein IWW52_002998 [Coemansia sp. RSA 2704]KAJ2387743.1 hypothetical protein H4S02_003214 [Coemansia sp. RSA 2611]